MRVSNLSIDGTSLALMKSALANLELLEKSSEYNHYLVCLARGAIEQVVNKIVEGMQETSSKIDWSKVGCIRPTDNEIIEMSRGSPPSSGCLNLYVCEHMNWAAKESGANRIYNTSCYPTGEDVAMITLLCKKIVKEENLKYIEPPRKKSWWNR